MYRQPSGVAPTEEDRVEAIVSSVMGERGRQRLNRPRLTGSHDGRVGDRTLRKASKVRMFGYFLN